MSKETVFPPSSFFRNLLVSRVTAVFNDQEKGETAVVRSANAMFDPGSVIWRVHGNVTTMMIGGVTALLLQMLHPSALAGVWDHSSFRGDMLGRLRRTARFIAVTTFAERPLADAAIDKVKMIHEHVEGVLDDGTPYRASDPHLLAWVHVCETIGFLDAWVTYAEPNMSAADQDTYVREAAIIARRLGADPVPETRAEAEALIATFKPELHADARTYAVADMILTQPSPSLAASPAQHLLMQAAVDLMPPWAKQMHKRRLSRPIKPLVHVGARTITRTLHWAFADARRTIAGR